MYPNTHTDAPQAAAYSKKCDQADATASCLFAALPLVRTFANKTNTLQNRHPWSERLRLFNPTGESRLSIHQARSFVGVLYPLGQKSHPAKDIAQREPDQTPSGRTKSKEEGLRPPKPKEGGARNEPQCSHVIAAII